MKFKINKGFIVEEEDGNAVIYDSGNSVLYTFNSTASYIFKRLKQGKKKKEIVDLMIKQYKITEKKANEDFDELISRLLKNKIIS